MKTFKYISLVLMVLLAASSCTEDNSYGKHTDVVYPLPIINTITANPMVGDTVTITGTNFVTPNTVTIDNLSMEILSQDSVHIVAVLPRIFIAAPIVVGNAYGRYSANTTNIQPIYPLASQITVSAWPTIITRGKPLVIFGTNMDLVTQVTIGSTVIPVNGLTQSFGRLLVLVPSTVAETQAAIQLQTIVGSSINSQVLPIQDPDPNFKAAPLTLMDFEDGITNFVPGDMPSNLYTAQINRSGIAPADGSNYFSLYTDKLDGTTYSMWTYLGSLKKTFKPALIAAQFTNPYLSFLWNSDDNIGAFQIAIKQGSNTEGGTFSPGKTNLVINNVNYDPNSVYDAYTLRPTNKQWQWITVPLSTLISENWGGTSSSFDPYGEIDAIEIVFKQINGVYWTGQYGPTINDVYNYNTQANHSFKANIDDVMITDGPYQGHSIP